MNTKKTIEEGINLEPTNIAGTKSGDMWVDIADGQLKSYLNGEEKSLSEGSLGPSDIPETDFTFQDNQTSVAVTGLNFTGDTHSFRALVYIERSTDGEAVELIGVNASGGWQLSTINPLGDDTGVDFNINAGQVEYTSTPTGNAGVIVFRASAIDYTV
jgi:hypothetical protein